MITTLQTFKNDLSDQLIDARQALKIIKQDICNSARAKDCGPKYLKALRRRAEKQTNFIKGLEIAWNLLNQNQHTNPPRYNPYVPETSMQLKRGETYFDVYK